jgi:hypothetical protein
MSRLDLAASLHSACNDTYYFHWRLACVHPGLYSVRSGRNAAVLWLWPLRGDAIHIQGDELVELLLCSFINRWGTSSKLDPNWKLDRNTTVRSAMHHVICGVGGFMAREVSLLVPLPTSPLPVSGLLFFIRTR